MAEIRQYVLLDENEDPVGSYVHNQHEYPDALREAERTVSAIVAYICEFSDTETVFTPDGSHSWPPDGGS